jgi:hypothetical protein
VRTGQILDEALVAGLRGATATGYLSSAHDRPLAAARGCRGRGEVARKRNPMLVVVTASLVSGFAAGNRRVICSR